MTAGERREALDAIAREIAVCTRCRLHEGRTRAVPGEGSPDTEVVFIGEGPGFNEDRQGRPFVGRAGDLLVRLLGTIGWRRDDVFITNIVKCRPPDNRDPEPDEIAACAPYLARQLSVLDPALVVTLGRHSMARFMPGARIGQAHGTSRPADPATGVRDALVYAMYHPAAALRSAEVERVSYADAAAIPTALLAARARREAVPAPEPGPASTDVPRSAAPAPAEPAATSLEVSPHEGTHPSADQEQARDRPLEPAIVPAAPTPLTVPAAPSPVTQPDETPGAAQLTLF